ncbi:hypothetical protein LTR36_008972 [Oleoguttula mirabilis]|uniref:Uncharacterized protein n=1 Tax=Oleoguttula mirabilis TaxID=1507867 RepID=A0AAV9J7Q1_9PEZI|nr:hypothetical protein LTR36_008972 [Oleoguttula mirabilis]
MQSQITLDLCSIPSQFEGAPKNVKALFGVPSIKIRAAPDPKAPKTSRATIRGKAISSSGVLREHKKDIYARQAVYVRTRARALPTPSARGEGGPKYVGVQDFNLPYEAQTSSMRLRELIDRSDDMEVGDADVVGTRKFDREVAGLQTLLQGAEMMDDAAGTDIAASVKTGRKMERDPFDLGRLLRSLEEAKGRGADGMEDGEEAFEERQPALATRSQHVAVLQTLGGAASSIRPANSHHTFGQASRPGNNLVVPARSSQNPANVVGNDFYKTDLSFDGAAEHFLVKLRDAKDNCQKWADVYSRERFTAFAREKKKTVLKVCESLYHMAQFLHCGREDWQFILWSMYFFAKAEALLPELLRCLGTLEAYPGCGWLKEKALVHAYEVRKMLAAIRGRKAEVERGRQDGEDAALESAPEAALQQ